MIEVKNLTKFYGDHKAVDDLSFTIKDGTVCGFLGPNGAGKSTTMNIMTGCLSATSGDVSINGFDIFDEPIEAKKTIGYLPEQPPLYMEETPREYLRFVAEAKMISRDRIRDEIDRVMEETQITDVADRLIKNLSKGYRQRVGIAQTLLGSPQVIILDEPTVGLDPIQVVEIRDLIKSLGKKHTVVLSSHILSEVQNMCDEILIISRGKLIAFDTAENLEKMMAPKTTIEVLTDATEEESREVLAGIEGIENIEYVEGGRKEEESRLLQIRIDTAQEEADGIRKVLSLDFAKIGRAVLKMDTVKANLEEIFIELTSPEEENGEEQSGTSLTWAEIAANAAAEKETEVIWSADETEVVKDNENINENIEKTENEEKREEEQ